MVAYLWGLGDGSLTCSEEPLTQTPIELCIAFQQRVTWVRKDDFHCIEFTQDSEDSAAKPWSASADNVQTAAEPRQAQSTALVWHLSQIRCQTIASHWVRLNISSKQM